MKFLNAFKYPKTSLSIVIIITIFFGFQLPKLVLNNDVVIFLPENNPHRKTFDVLSEQFDKSDGIIIAATVKKGFIYQKENLEALKKLNDALVTIDSVDNILSITSTDYVDGVEGGIETFPIVNEIPQSELQEQEIKNRLESWDIYKNTIYTEDYRTSLSMLKLKKNSIKRDKMIYQEVIKITREYRDVFDIQIAGSPAIFVLVSENMEHDLARLIPYVILVVLVTLWISFRRPSGVILPMITVIISTIWSLGLMSLLGVEMTLIATVIPVLLVAVGSAYGIHIMTHYFEEFSKRASDGKNLSEKEHEELLGTTMHGVGKAVMLAALTTMAGFGSLATSKIIPVRDFGIFTFVGVFAAFVVAVLFIPSVLHFYHSRKSQKITTEKNTIADTLLVAIERTSHHPIAVLITVAITVILSFAGMLKVKNGNAIINFFKPNSSVWQANNWLQTHTNGTSTLDIVIRGKESGSLVYPEILSAIDKFSIYIKQTNPNVKKTGSLVDLIKRLNYAMHAEEIAADSSSNYSEIPVDPIKYGLNDQEELKQLISQYLMLFSGDIKQYADDGIEPKTARILLQINTNEVDSLRSILNNAQNWLQKNLPDGYTFEIGGTADAEIEVNRLIIDSQIKSILSSLIIVFLLLSFFFKSITAGIYGIICLVIPLLINFGVMGFFNIGLDIATAMVSSIAIGIGIDYMIHYMSAFSIELKKNNGVWDKISTITTLSYGRAIIFNAVSVALGFAVILFSNFIPLNNLGGMIFLTMATSSLVSLTLLPVLFNKFKPSFLAGKKGDDKKVNHTKTVQPKTTA
ncbi:MAG: RND family transporter [Fibrobacter sp.]|nr:RND family transporter [Fibrobacter sp.]